MGKPKKLRKLMKAAKMRNSHAMYQLGIWYETGHMVPKDMEKAVCWISESAQSGYAPAMEWIKDYSFDDDANLQAHT